MLHKHFAEVSQDLQRKSNRIREAFASHRPSAGENREALVGDFLREYLPKAVEIGTGLVLSQDGEFSNQADLVIVDQQLNAPLYGSSPEQIWFIESVLVLFEVKTQLTPTTLKDSVEKCRRFKTLPRSFADTFGQQRIVDSLFVLWSFEGPSAETVIENYKEAVEGIPHSVWPDFIVVPGALLVRSGDYFDLSVRGQPNSDYRRQLVHSFEGQLPVTLRKGFDVWALGDNVVLAFLIWLQSWLVAAGPRRVNLLNYVPRDFPWGRLVQPS